MTNPSMSAQAIGDFVELPMSSGVRVPPAHSVRITSRPQNHTLDMRRLVIQQDPDNWVVNSLTVNGAPQISPTSELPGAMFSQDADAAYVLAPCARNDEVALVATYVGSKKDGEEFVAHISGYARLSDDAIPAT